jgi:hypothetical protein
MAYSWHVTQDRVDRFRDSSCEPKIAIDVLKYATRLEESYSLGPIVNSLLAS